MIEINTNLIKLLSTFLIHNLFKTSPYYKCLPWWRTTKFVLKKIQKLWDLLQKYYLKRMFGHIKNFKKITLNLDALSFFRFYIFSDFISASVSVVMSAKLWKPEIDQSNQQERRTDEKNQPAFDVSEQQMNERTANEPRASSRNRRWKQRCQPLNL